MKHPLIILTGGLFLAAWRPLCAQDPSFLPAAAEEQLEHNLHASTDDTHWQELHTYSRRKLSLNTADAAALRSLGLLTPLQINSLLTYRRLLGALASIYELQAVPGFDTALIYRLLPYVTTGSTIQPSYTWRDYMHAGEHALLLRYERQLERARGYKRSDTAAAHYAGTPDQLLLRYRYSFPRYVSWGLTMEKDAGEQFFKGAQRTGFDFYSAHFFLRDYKKIRALVLGDFTVNMGQGLIHWQSPAFGKSAMVMQIKREGEVLRPYVSAGEFLFFRGAGITLQEGSWQLTGFASLRQLDGSTAGEDSLEYVSAMVTGGYHRTAAEAARKGVLQQRSAGANVVYDNGNWCIGLNVIQHLYSAPFRKGVKPYQMFALDGDRFFNVSLDYSGNWKQLHCFGETAADAAGNIATVNGILASLAPRVDAALLYRHYSRAYQAVNGNAFGNNARPQNESGWYTALSLRITPHIRWEGYADLFRFPWLKYRVHAPTAGRDLQMMLTYTPDKHTEVFVRYRYSNGVENASAMGSYIPPLADVVKHGWRWQLSMPLGQPCKLRSRLELIRTAKAGVQQEGWLCYHELQYKFADHPLSVSARITWFGTGGSGSTVYAMESGIGAGYSVQQFNGEGWQYNVGIKWKMRKRLSCWLRWSRIRYRDAATVGSGWDAIDGPGRSNLQLQVQLLL
ncbi:helix-hairpin-helix domain-containing protein [uncultured Chitinophaga sp.]|jgi:DNA uptake protein and related DNA-binding proteins|uniref:ComEA family DNA-binding protein n=1 Tax=uncultured Chitinophaga sp. TaxID=339340 RepID=UPI0026019042|nr:helix-hairpin-helix domain-containing protein [uncultured Chitinophaga sp.]